MDDTPGPIPAFTSGRNETKAITGGLRGGAYANKEQINRLAYGGEQAASQPNIRERLYKTISNGEYEIRRAERAQRALQLLEAHPEVAELVELLREF